MPQSPIWKSPQTDCTGKCLRFCLELIYFSSWYFGKLSRGTAVSYLSPEFNTAGSYLIRQSDSRTGSYVLSIKIFEDDNQRHVYKHYEICSEDGMFFLRSRWVSSFGTSFHSLESTIFSYRIFFLSGRNANPEKYPSLVDFVESAQARKQKKLERQKAVLKEICIRPKPTVNIGARSGHWVIDGKDIVFVRFLGAGNFGEVNLCKHKQHLQHLAWSVLWWETFWVLPEYCC